MPNYPRGKLSFEHHTVDTVEGSEDTVESFSCYPPPVGRRTGGNPQLTIDPHQPGSFMQPGERTRLETFGANQGETLTLATLIGELKTEFGIKPMTINLANVPQAWRIPVPCFDTVIVVTVETVLLRIDAVASEAVSQGNVNWPKGDTVASFRITVPDKYKFKRYMSWNLDCCPWGGPPGTQPPIIPPQDDPAGWHGDNFEPFSYEPGWQLEFGLDWQYNKYKWGAHLDYGEYLVPFTDEELGGELLPGQPWILPYPKAHKHSPKKDDK
jgi:hypothetical protein